ncbi:MAG: type II secretion system F family protein, partial [Actinobacteria bacterium]|nr:type II secretion system F family protein [Actinomycetota bacterium]
GSRVGLLTFASKPRIVTPVSPDHAGVLAALEEPPATTSGTALYDAVVTASRMFSGSGQRSIVLLANGPNNVGVTDLEGALGVANDAQTTIYSVGFRDLETDVQTMIRLARGTGGWFSPAQTANLSEIYESLAGQIASQYLVSYSSTAKPGAQVSIDVTAGAITDSALVLAPKGAPAPHPPKKPVPVEPAKPLLRGTWGFAVVVGMSFLAAFLVLVMLLGTGARIRREREMAARMGAVAKPHEVAPERRPQGPAAWVPQAMVQMAGRVADVGGFSATVDHRLEQAGLPLRAGEFVIAMAAATILGGVLGMILLGNYLFALLTAAGAAFVPFVVVRIAIRRRTGRLHAQLADVLTILASSLRAGHSFMQALDTVAKEIPAPGAEEFGRVVAEIRLGRPVDEALDAMAERVGSYDFKWAVLAVNIQREVGGNLAEILDTVAETVRERDAIRRQVDVLTTEGRLSMYILTALPVAIGLYMAVVNREYLSILFSDPIGIVMSVTASCLIVIGFLWMKRIVKIDV